MVNFIDPHFQVIFNKINSLKENINNSINECDITTETESLSKGHLINELEVEFTQLKEATEKTIDKLKSNLSDLASLVQDQKIEIQVKL